MVIDIKMLKKLGLQLSSALVAIVPLAVAYSTFGTATKGNDEVCSLAPNERAGLALWHSMANSSCTYTFSVGPAGIEELLP